MSPEDAKLCEAIRTWTELAQYANGGWDLPAAGTKALAANCNKACSAIERLSARVAELEAKIADGVIVPELPPAQPIRHVEDWILHDGCNYFAWRGSVCTKCGKIAAARKDDK